VPGHNSATSLFQPVLHLGDPRVAAGFVLVTAGGAGDADAAHHLIADLDGRAAAQGQDARNVGETGRSGTSRMRFASAAVVLPKVAEVKALRVAESKLCGEAPSPRR
jgi:hypothetical protein